VAYLFAARFVVACHLGFVAFVFLGGRAIIRRRRLIWLHGSCLVYAVVAMMGLWSCPLTLLEQWLLEAAGAPVYTGEFLPHYVWEPLGLSGTEPFLVVAVLLVLVLTNYAPYVLYVRR
jgi:hypothetical protein